MELPGWELGLSMLVLVVVVVQIFMGLKLRWFKKRMNLDGMSYNRDDTVTGTGFKVTVNPEFQSYQSISEFATPSPRLQQNNNMNIDKNKRGQNLETKLKSQSMLSKSLGDINYSNEIQNNETVSSTRMHKSNENIFSNVETSSQKENKTVKIKQTNNVDSYENQKRKTDHSESNTNTSLLKPMLKTPDENTYLLNTTQPNNNDWKIDDHLYSQIQEPSKTIVREPENASSSIKTDKTKEINYSVSYDSARNSYEEVRPEINYTTYPTIDNNPLYDSVLKDELDKPKSKHKKNVSFDMQIDKVINLQDEDEIYTEPYEHNSHIKIINEKQNIETENINDYENMREDYGGYYQNVNNMYSSQAASIFFGGQTTLSEPKTLRNIETDNDSLNNQTSA